MIAVRKLKVICKDKEFYNFFNMEQREQNKALNMAISLRHVNNTLKSIDSGAEVIIIKSIDKLNRKIETLEKELKNENITKAKKEKTLKAIETHKKIIKGEQKKLEKGRIYRKGLDKEFSQNYLDKTQLYHVLDGMTSIQHKRTIELVREKVKKDYENNFIDIVTGKQSLPNYKSDFPLMIDGSSIHIFEEDGIYKIKIMRGYELEVILGRRENENILELRKTLDRCSNGEYKVCQSEIQRDKNNNIIFNLTIDIPIENKKYTPVEGRVLGVDLGIKYPVYMCLNDDTYKRTSLGNINNFLRVREQMQERRRDFQKDLTLTKGGKGKSKKTQLLNKLRENEKNFCKTYNHTMSKRVVEFAKKHNCEYIHIENLTKDGFSNSILRNWSYYELQKFIKYKADREGIVVKYIEPAYTSQMCSKCGYTDKENRQTQAEFKCISCGFKLNADHNASINIARSNKFVK